MKKNNDNIPVSKMTRKQVEDELKVWFDRAKKAERLLNRASNENDANKMQLASARMYLMSVINYCNAFAPLHNIEIQKDLAFKLFNTKDLKFVLKDGSKDTVYVSLIDKEKGAKPCEGEALLKL